MFIIKYFKQWIHRICPVSEFIHYLEARGLEAWTRARLHQNRVVCSFSMKSDRRPALSHRGKSSWMGTFNTSARN
jgi:hypothetical protein